MAQGQGVRCAGFKSEDGRYARCTRPERAGSLPLDEKTTPATYLHYLMGDCKCGASHDQTAPAPHPNSNGNRNQKSMSLQTVATYEYQDAEGRLCYQVMRKEPDPQTIPPTKDFPQRHSCPSRDGDWVWNLGGKPEKCPCLKIDRLPYRLPELLAADVTATVYIPEGEKDVDRLRSSGLVATCNSRGAGKWEDRYAEWLNGRDVVVLPDFDEPGIKHGQEVARMLNERVRTVRVVDLPGLGANGADVSDWLDQGGTVEELFRLTDLASEWEPNSSSADDQPATYQVPDLNVTTIKNVQHEQVNWLWPKRIPLGKLTVFGGDPGLGKSYMTLDIAARVSLGGPWPDADSGRAPLGNVLLVSAEDGLADTIRPRLDLLGADVGKVHAIATTLKQDDKVVSLSLADHLEPLERAIVEYQAVLLIIDPILAFTCKKADTYKSSDVRAVLAPLAAMAERTNCAILSVLHLNKRSPEGNSIYRMTASLDFTAAARSALVVGKHPDNPEHRVMAPVKSNLSAPPPSLAFHFTEDGYFTWDGEVDFDANSILSAPDSEERTARDDAKKFLRDVLSDGSIPAKDVIEDGRQCGYNETTLRRAAKDIGVESARVGGIGKKGSWEWYLPKDAPVQKGDHLSKSDHLSGESTPIRVQSDLFPSDNLSGLKNGSDHLSKSDDLDRSFVPERDNSANTPGGHLANGNNTDGHLDGNQSTKIVTQDDDSGTDATKIVTPHTGHLSKSDDSMEV